MEKASPFMREAIKTEAKEAIIGVLEDPEIAAGLTQYGDALFSRYSKKFWGSIGGKQKGLNFAVADAAQDVGIFDDEGNISIASIIRTAMTGGFKNLMGGGGGKGSSPTQPSSSGDASAYMRR